MNVRSFICICFMLLGIASSKAQNYNHYMNSSYDYRLNLLLDSIPNFHSSIKPYLINDINNFLDFDSLQNSKSNSLKQYKNTNFNNIIFNRNLLQVEKKDFTLIINPIFDFSGGKDFSNSKSTYTNSRGIQITGNLGNNFSFYTNVYESQAIFPEYVSALIDQTGIVPGQGLRRNLGSSYDYSMSNGYISYSPSKYFNFQFGSGKNFIGNGYRSLLLSDNAFNYPFLKITTTFWKIKYINLFTEFTDLQTNELENQRFNKKFASIHYLSWNATDRLSIGIFEAVIFSDSTGQRGFEMSYLNPIIFFRPVEFANGSPDNIVLGFNFSYKMKPNALLYGQVVFDEFRLKEITNGSGFWHNKFGYQLGVKLYEFMKVKNLYAQFEYNRVRPYTYSHLSGLQNYGHYNQALAHPFGANFWEFISIMHYQVDRLHFNYKFIYSKYGEDYDGKNYGKDIYKSYETKVQEYGNKVGQGLETKLIYNNIEISYLINPKYNSNIALGLTSRISKTDFSTHKTTFVYFSLRTSIDNFYFDF